MDEINRKIIDILSIEGRISMKELGKRVALSGSSVTERVRKLEEQGIIRGYSADIDRSKCGCAIHAFLHCDVPFAERKQIDEILRRIRETPEIVAAYCFLTGGKDLLLEIYCRDMDDFNRIQQKLYHLLHTTTYLMSMDSLKVSGSKIPYHS